MQASVFPLRLTLPSSLSMSAIHLFIHHRRLLAFVRNPSQLHRVARTAFQAPAYVVRVVSSCESLLGWYRARVTLSRIASSELEGARDTHESSLEYDPSLLTHVLTSQSSADEGVSFCIPIRASQSIETARGSHSGERSSSPSSRTTVGSMA